MSDRIKVGIKLRPLIKREKASQLRSHWETVSDNQIAQVDASSGCLKGEPFTFDHVFGTNSSNQEVFEVLVKPIVESAVRGFNGTIFAYGQTASGKTYTMMGDHFEPGIIPQAVNFIFNSIENTHGREFLLRVCYMEIYNEKVNDLLVKSNRNLKVSEDPHGNVIVKDLEETITNSAQMVMDLMKKGETIRKIGVTNMNERSSRSHSIFRVIIESRVTGSDADEAIQVSHLNLVDLAGSERAGATGSVGDQFKEGCAINTSLFTLGKVISQLSEGDTAYVNYRDSKLTRILQSSLGGNALTAIICAVTPAAVEETNSTLGFASRARNIKLTATVNEVLSDRALLKRYVRQIDRLTSAINSMKEEKSAENENLQKENSLLQERINRLKDTLLVSSTDFTENSEKNKEKLKRLRRRTWSAPNRNMARLSLAFPMSKKLPSVSELEDLREETPINILSRKSEDCLDESDVFSTPLEEFERALIKAERAKSMDEEDWLPALESFEDEPPISEYNAPAINYVQTRKPRQNLLKCPVDSVLETPPSKLRAKISVVEKELDEIAEFTRLEKQMFDEALHAELNQVKTELKEAHAQIDALRCVQEQMDQFKMIDRTSHDYQVMLMDSSKEVSKLRDENQQMKKQLQETTAKCQDLDIIKDSLDKRTKEIFTMTKEKAALNDRLRKSEELVFQLQNEKEDFDVQLEMAKSKYELRLRDLSQALESARMEASQLQGPQQKRFYGQLYSVEEEPTIEELMEHVQCLKQENLELKEKVFGFSLEPVKPQQSSNDDDLRILQEKLTDMEKELCEARTLICNSCQDTDVDETTPLVLLVTTVLSNLASTKDMRKQLENQNRSAQLQLEHLIEVASEDTDALRSANDDLKIKLEVQEIAYVKLSAENDALKEQFRELQNSSCTSNSETLHNQLEVEKLCGKIVLLERTLTDVHNLICSFDGIACDESTSAPEHLHEIVHKVQNMIEMHKNIDSRNQLIEEQERTLAEERARLQNDVDEMKSELECKENFISQAAIEMEQLRDKLRDMQHAVSERANSSQMSSDGENLGLLQGKLSDTEKELFEVRTLICNSCQDTDVDETTPLVLLVTTILSNLASTKDMCKQLENQNRSAQSQIEHLIEVASEDTDALRSANDDLKIKLEVQEIAYGKLSSENYALKEQFRELQNSSSTSNSETLYHQLEVKELCMKTSPLEGTLAADCNLICATADCSTGITCDENKSLLKVMDGGKRQVDNGVLEHSNNPCLPESLKNLTLCQKEIEVLKAEESSLKDELNCKNNVIKDIEQEVQELRRTVQDLQDVLKAADSDVCTKCSKLELELQSAKNAIISEIKAISGDSKALNVPVTSSISMLLSSVLEAQAEVASVQQKKLEDKLQAWLKTENQLIETVACLETKVKDHEIKEEKMSLNLQKFDKEKEDLEAKNTTLMSQTAKLEGLVNKLQNDLQLLASSQSLQSKATELSNEISEIGELKKSEKIISDHQLLIDGKDEEIKVLEQSVNDFISSKTTLEAENAILSSQTEKLEADVNKLQNDLKEQSRQLASSQLLQSKATELSNEISEMGELKKSEKIISDHQLLIDGKDEEIKVLKLSVNDLVSSKTTLEGDLMKARAENAILSSQTEKLEADVNELQNDLKEESRQLASSQSKATELCHEISEKGELLKKSEKIISDHQLLIDGKDEEIKVLEQSVNDFISSKTTLEAENAILSSQTEKLEADVNKLQNDLKEQSRQLASSQLLQSKATELSNEISEMGELKKSEKIISDHQLLIDGKDEEIKVLKLSVNDLVSSKTTLEGDLMKARAENAILSNQTEKLEADVNELQNDLKEQSRQLASKQLLQSKATELHNEISEKEELLKKSEKIISDHQLLIDGKDEEIKVLEQSVNELVSSKTTLEGDLMKARAENAILSSQTEKLEADVNKLQNDLKEQSLQLASKQLLQSEATELHNEISEKEELLKKSEKIISDHQLLIDGKDEEIKVLEQSVNELVFSKTTLEGDLMKARAENAILSSQTEKLEADVNELQNDLKEQSRQLASKQLLQSKATELYNDVSEKKELLKKLEKIISDHQLLLNEKDEEISLLKQSVNDLISSKTILEADLIKARAEKDLALKSSLTPPQEILELKAEIETLKHQHEAVIKSSRDAKLRNRRLQTELIKLKECQETEAIGKTDVSDATENSNRNVVECCQCKKKTEKILQLQKEKVELDNDCEEVLKWGQTLEKNLNQFALKLSTVLKDLAGTKKKLFVVTSEQIYFLKKFSREMISSLSKVDAEQMEMQLASKEKAARNAQTRAEVINCKINSLYNKALDLDQLQDLCVELNKENVVISGLHEEAASIWNRILKNRKPQLAQKNCEGCDELLKWGQEQEAKALASSNLVDRLEGKLQARDENAIYHTRSSRRKQFEFADPLSKGQSCLEQKEQIQKQQTELAEKTAEIGHLKLKLQIQNKPAEERIRRLEDRLKACKEESAILKAEMRRRTASYEDTTVIGASSKGKMKNAGTQTLQSADDIHRSQYWPSTPSGIVDEANRVVLQDRVKKLEREKETYKTLCIKRKERCDFLEQQLNEQKENEPSAHYTLRSKRNN